MSKRRTRAEIEEDKAGVQETHNMGVLHDFLHEQLNDLWGAFTEAFKKDTQDFSKIDDILKYWHSLPGEHFNRAMNGAMWLEYFTRELLTRMRALPPQDANRT